MLAGLQRGAGAQRVQVLAQPGHIGLQLPPYRGALLQPPGPFPQIGDALLGEAMERAAAYAEAGAHSFFVPGVSDADLIADICARSPLPVNVIKPDAVDIATLAHADVARISWGPKPWRWAMERLGKEAEALYR